MATLLRDIIDIPEDPHGGEFVLWLSKSVGDNTTLRDYVVTPQLARSFDQALSAVHNAVESKTSRATYLDGSFGSGKSHFMAVLHALLRGDPQARSLNGLTDVVGRHDHWLQAHEFLLIPFHLITASSLESAVLGGYVEHVRNHHSEAHLPAVYRDETLLDDARALRTSMGDEAFIAGLAAGTGTSTAGDAWGEADWDSQALDEAFAAARGSSERERLVSALLGSFFSSYQRAARDDADAYIPLAQGLTVISRHAREVLGYDAIVLLLDELVLWLNTNLGNQEFVRREAQKVVNLIESAEYERPAPIVSFVPRQRDLRELVGRDSAGGQSADLFDILQYWEGRFGKVKLEDRNLSAVVQKRLVAARDTAAEQQVDAAFERLTRTQPAVWETLLDAQGSGADADAFRQTYPFSPAFLHAMIDISGALQRQRTALKLMRQLLVDYRNTLELGQLMPLGAIYDVLAAGGDRPFTDKLRDEFEQARAFYTNRLRPSLLAKHNLTEDEAAELPLRHAFRGDDLVVKTLLLAALVPQVPALQGLTVSRLAALNHGWIPAMVRGQERGLVAATLKSLASEHGEIHVGEGDDPTVELGVIGVDTKGILERARVNTDDPGHRRAVVKDLLWQALGVRDTGEITTRHQVTWRGTVRTAELVFVNARDKDQYSATMFEPDERGVLRVTVDYPFDEEGIYSPADDINRLSELCDHHPQPFTLSWLPSFLSRERMYDLGDLTAIEHVLERDRLAEYTPYLSDEDRHHARVHLQNRRAALRQSLHTALTQAYGVAAPEDANLSKRTEKHLMRLESGTDPKPPAGLALDAALNHICRELFDQLYPEHPNFDPEGRGQPYKPRDLETVLRVVERGVEDPVGRYEVPPTDIPTVRRIVNPLGLGVMHEGAYVLDADWKLRIERRAGGATADIEVSELREWIADERPGLPSEIINLLISAYALQADRAWVRSGNVIAPPGVKNIPGDIVLRAQELPTPEEFATASERAAGVFGVDGQPVCSARAVHALATQLRQRASQLLGDAQALIQSLNRHAATLGLDDTADSGRLATAHTCSRLLDHLAGTGDDTALLRVLAGFELTAPPEFYRASLHHARQVTDALGAVRWRAIEALQQRVAAGDGHGEAAQTILDRLHAAARHDEHATHLAPALKEAEDAALELITEQQPPQPPPGDQQPDGETTASAGGSIRARRDDVEQVMSELRAVFDTQPDVELEITWRPVAGGFAGDGS